MITKDDFNGRLIRICPLIITGGGGGWGGGTNFQDALKSRTHDGLISGTRDSLQSYTCITVSFFMYFDTHQKSPMFCFIFSDSSQAIMCVRYDLSI